MKIIIERGHIDEKIGHNAFIAKRKFLFHTFEIGYISFNDNIYPGIIDIVGFSVKLKYRRRHVGKMLMAKVIKYGEANNFRKLQVHPCSTDDYDNNIIDNQILKDIYKSYGFRDSGKIGTPPYLMYYDLTN